MQELDLIDANPDWRRLLHAYSERRTADRQWVSRIGAVEGLEPGQLSSIHGKLIALGLLKFDLDSQSGGLAYQVTSLGRQALLGPAERQSLNEWQVTDEAA